MSRVVHPIESRSYGILRARADTSALPPLTRAVVERVVHASADLDYLDGPGLRRGSAGGWAAALRAGAPVVADVEMVAAGITAP